MQKTFKRKGRCRLEVAKLAASLSLFVLACAGNFTAEEKTPSTDVREQAWSVLMEGLRHDHASHRAVAVQALSLMAGNRPAVQLATHALDDKNFHVRTAAAMSLGQLHASSAIPALHKALDDPEISVVLAATQSLYMLKDKTAYDVYYAILMKDRKSSNSLMQAQLDRLKDPKQMMQLGFQEGVGFVPFGGMGYEAFREITHGSGSSVRAAAARFLASDPDQISEDALVQAAVVDNNEEVRLASLDALAQRGDPRVIGRLAKNLNEDKSAVRYRTAAVILHLSRLGKRKTK
jgi:HEAT repeat protein